MPVKNNPRVIDPSYDEQPGNDYNQRDADSKTWRVKPEMFFGGVMEDLGCYSGPQVGPAFDATAMGNERKMITYESTGGKGVKPSTKRGG